MANRSYDRNIFGRKVQTQKKNIRQAITPTAVTAMNEVSNICTRALQAFFDDAGVKSGYRNILMVLGKEDGVSQLYLSKETGLKPSTISIGLKRMEHDGYITRANDIKDMRMTRVYLTQKGLDVTNGAYEICEKVSNILLSDIPETELASVMAVAEKMKQNYQNSEYDKRDEI